MIICDSPWDNGPSAQISVMRKTVLKSVYMSHSWETILATFKKFIFSIGSAGCDLQETMSGGTYMVSFAHQFR